MNDPYEVVSKLNEEISDALPLDCPWFIYLSAISDGWVTVIEFMDIPIWNSDDDERHWFNDEDREDLETFVRREMNYLLNILKKIKI